MVDWLTHSLIGWITGKTIKIEISLIVIGSLIPDLFKSYLVFNWFTNSNTQNFFLPIHTPFGSALIATVFALLFPDTKKALIPLGIGITTHFILDLSLLNVSGGILLLYPFSWNQWQLGLIRSDDYTITVYAIIAAIIISSLYFVIDKRKTIHYQPNRITTSNINNKNNIIRITKKETFSSNTPIKTTPQIYYINNQIHNQTNIQEFKHLKHTSPKNHDQH
jgi:uncharacterized membrane protein YraQ (UPF0718 family)